MYANSTVAMQSPWVYELYNQHLDYKTDGFLVEIGVGHTLLQPQQVTGVPMKLEDIEIFDRCSSNTASLLDLGWSGIYIDPVIEYCDEARLAHEANLDRLIIVNAAASNEESTEILRLGDSFVVGQEFMQEIPWVGREIQTRVASDILDENNCPEEIDVMSIDVEGFEIKVLDGLNLDKYRPKVMIIEIDTIGLVAINDFIRDKYELVKFDHLNGFWVRKDG